MVTELTNPTGTTHRQGDPSDVVWLTNIPTPYRHHRFRALSSALESRGSSLHVVYMAKREAHRPWGYVASDADYSHEILSGISLRVAGRPVHMNPGAILMARKAPRVMVVGGVSNPSAWMAMAAASKDTRTLLGVESNAKSQRLGRGPAAWIKRWMVDSADGFLIPGEASLDYLRTHRADATHKPTVRMPNIIDESLFPARGSAEAKSSREAVRQRLSIPADAIMVLAPARLEPFKGISDLLDALELVDRDRPLIVVMAGTGSLKRVVEERGGKAGVISLGQVADQQMPELYAAADVFALVSHRDPSPLTVIEAARSGLPLLLSDSVGNAAEALRPGWNGWSVPSGDPPSIAAVLTQIADMGRISIQEMGDRSAEHHGQELCTEVVVARAADALVAFATETGGR